MGFAQRQRLRRGAKPTVAAAAEDHQFRLVVQQLSHISAENTWLVICASFAPVPGSAAAGHSLTSQNRPSPSTSTKPQPSSTTRGDAAPILARLARAPVGGRLTAQPSRSRDATEAKAPVGRRIRAFSLRTLMPRAECMADTWADRPFIRYTRKEGLGAWLGVGLLQFWGFGVCPEQRHERGLAGEGPEGDDHCRPPRHRRPAREDPHNLATTSGDDLHPPGPPTSISGLSVGIRWSRQADIHTMIWLSSIGRVLLRPRGTRWAARRRQERWPAGPRLGVLPVPGRASSRHTASWPGARHARRCAADRP
jgi:hypothetical protein